MDKRITITGELQKDNNEIFTEKEKEQFLDDFIQFIENKKYVFVGITK